MKDVIDKLRDDEHYYGEFGRQYMSNSNIGALLNNPSMFGAVTQETVPMVVGRFLHVALLEPEKLGSFNVVDASSRNTNIYKDAVKDSKEDMLLLLSEKQLPLFSKTYLQKTFLLFFLTLIQNLHHLSMQ